MNIPRNISIKVILKLFSQQPEYKRLESVDLMPNIAATKDFNYFSVDLDVSIVSRPRQKETKQKRRNRTAALTVKKKPNATHCELLKKTSWYSEVQSTFLVSISRHFTDTRCAIYSFLPLHHCSHAALTMNWKLFRVALRGYRNLPARELPFNIFLLLYDSKNTSLKLRPSLDEIFLEVWSFIFTIRGNFFFVRYFSAIH